MDMRSLGNIVSKRPVTTLIVVLIVTAIFGMYAAQMQMSADLKTFLPNDEMVKADEKISDEFGDTDYVEIIFKSSNALSKSTLLDMLRVENSLENDSLIKNNLKTPSNPSESFMSPADVIVMGNITLDFQRKLMEMLDNILQEKINFTILLLPIKTMNDIMGDYHDIYENASDIRDDAKTLVLMLFITPSNSTGGDNNLIKSLLQNISLTLINSNDFGIKSKVLTILTPPMISGNESGNMSENPLFYYFLNDMKSNNSLENKTISVHFFSEANNFTWYSLNYTNSSINQSIYAIQQIILHLNNTKNYILSGDNKSALDEINGTIYSISNVISFMKYYLPYYIDYNRSLSKFLYDFNSGIVSQEDIMSVEKNTSTMIKIARGDFKESLLSFNETFIEWTEYPNIYYDTIYEANSTRQVCEGYINSYYGLIQLNNSVTYVKMQINHNTTQNTTMLIDQIIYELNYENNKLKKELGEIQGAMEAMKSPYALWFSSMLINMEYVMKHSNVGIYAVNIFNNAASIMNSTYNTTRQNYNMMNIFYSMKHAFDSNVSNVYKYKIQDMYLDSINLMNLPHKEINFTMPSGGFNPPNFNPDIDKRRSIISNMSQGEIYDTLHSIENYDPSNLTDKLNESLPIIENISNNMTLLNLEIEKLLKNMGFVYHTTENESVEKSMEFYAGIHENMTNASSMMGDMLSNLPSISGFSYMMDQLSGNIKSMFSKDFNGHHAKAAMMIVMLNSTYLSEETTEHHSDRMEKLEERVENIATTTRDSNTEVMVMGTYLISKATEKTANETMDVLLPVAMILVVIILLITFRSLLDTLWGLLGLGMAIAWAYGFGVMMSYSFNEISTTVAVLLVGLGIDYAIHTILRYREELRKGRKVREAMNEMITHLGMGLVLATITTIVAFLSNVTSPIPPIQDFGVMNAVGIFGAFIIFTTAIPAIKIIVDERREKKGKLKIKKEEERVGSGVVALNKFMSLGAIGAEHHRYTVITVIGLITLGAIFAGLNVGTTFDIKDFLPSNLPISNTIQFMMDNFNTSGMNDNYVLIEGNITNENAIKAVKMTMDNMKDDDYIDLTQSQSITTYINEWKEKNTTFAKMVNGNDTDHDGYPDKNITSIYNWLYEHGDAKNILHKSNGKYDSMLIIVRSTASTDAENKKLYSEMKEDIKPFKKYGLTATITGANLLTYHITDLLQSSEWDSLIVTIIVSLIVLVPIFYYESRSWVLGAITMLPVVIAMLWLVGTMYLLGINFNVATVTTTSLTIGLGITYSIHITHRFLEDMKNEKRIEDAIRKTIRHTGTAIFGAAATTMAGFGTLMLSSMPPIRQFGEIATLSILYSFILAVFILPSFLYVWAERRKRGKSEKPFIF